MTCDQALDIIDSLSFEERRSHLMAVVEPHTQNCEGCRSALESAMALDSQLSRLPEPQAPAALMEVINAHTALHARKREMRAAVKPRVVISKAGKRRSAWTLLWLGTIIALGAQAFRILAGEWELNLTSSPLYQRTDDFLVMLQGSPATLLLLGSLLLYSIGFFLSMEAETT